MFGGDDLNSCLYRLYLSMDEIHLLHDHLMASSTLLSHAYGVLRRIGCA